MFKINTQRTYRYPVSVTIYDGDQEVEGTFKAEFKAVPRDEIIDDQPLLDQVLVDVHGLEVTGKEGKVLAGDELLAAVKVDPAISLALVSAYQDSYAKKNRTRI